MALGNSPRGSVPSRAPAGFAARGAKAHSGVNAPPDGGEALLYALNFFFHFPEKDASASEALVKAVALIEAVALDFYG